MDNVFTLKQLAERWGCSAQTVKSVIDDGTLPCFKIGRLTRVSMKAVTEYERRF